MQAGKVFQVSEITELIKAALEEGFPFVCIEGEISNFRPASSGHLYFSLKDSGAVIQAVMFKGKLRGLSFQPADGMLVRAYGSISVYAQRGSYQIVCDTMEKSGVGDILLMLEERKMALAAEGLFDEGRKRPIPKYPSRIAVITSPTGAAIRDILNVLKRRNSGIDVVVLPALVQGEEAAETLLLQLETANRYSMADVIIIGRGGGSLKDLLPFSDEKLVRGIAASTIPVISAVGHEVDWSIADLAADLRAPTPSAAAELVSPDREELKTRVSSFKLHLVRELRGLMDRSRLMLRQFHPENLDLLFRKRLQPDLQRLDDARETIFETIRLKTEDARRRAESALTLLEASSPKSILQRGYSIVSRRKDGKVVRNSREISSGEELNLRFAAGRAQARTEEVFHEEI